MGVRQTPVALFAAGRGGSPARHPRLLECLGDAGFDVIAPESEMIAGHRPSASELGSRIDGLYAALDEVAEDRPVVGIGHSIGATVLAALAGATMWLGPGQPLAVPRSGRLQKLVLLAPPVGFFEAPGALDGLRIPLMLRSGGADTITPPASHQAFAARLPITAAVDLAIEPLAGHFSFMDSAPPGQPPAFDNEFAFRERLYQDIIAFAQ